MLRLFQRRRVRLGLRRKAPGQGLVEYALILALIAIVVIGALTALGTTTKNKFGQINCSLSGGSWHTDNGNGNSSTCR